jgi:hypothetical protein
MYGILGAGKYMADAGDYIWFVNDAGGIQRTKKSNNQTFASIDPSLKTTPANPKAAKPTVVLEMIQLSGQDTDKDSSDDSFAPNFKIDNPDNFQVTSSLASVVQKASMKGLNPAVAGDYAISDDAKWDAADISVKDIKNIFVSPDLTYQYFNGSSFVTVNVPKFLFLIKVDSIICVKLPSAFRWEDTYKANQYAAVSTGGLGYKQG